MRSELNSKCISTQRPKGNAREERKVKCKKVLMKLELTFAVLWLMQGLELMNAITQRREGNARKEREVKCKKVLMKLELTFAVFACTSLAPFA
jgi:hypothetical protein